MIPDGKKVRVKGQEGEFDLPKLDGLPGERSISFGAGEKVGRHGSLGFAQEEHVDGYLLRYARPLSFVTRFTDARQAHYLILQARQGRKDRSRLKAAYQIAKFWKDHVALKHCLHAIGGFLDYDGIAHDGKVLTAWLWLDAEFTGVYVEAGQGKLWLGQGDGYYRQGGYDVCDGGDGPVEADDEDETPHPAFYQATPLDSPMAVKTALYQTALLGIEDKRGWSVPCDERYWHSHERYRPLLEKRVEARHAGVKAALSRARKALAPQPKKKLAAAV